MLSAVRLAQLILSVIVSFYDEGPFWYIVSLDIDGPLACPHTTAQYHPRYSFYTSALASAIGCLLARYHLTNLHTTTST